MSTEKTLAEKKQELLDKNWMSRYNVYEASDMILKVMDEWAEIVAKDFMNKCVEHFQGTSEGYVYLTNEKCEIKTVDELFSEFKGREYSH
jgi:hypothetical protein